jgi:hypothetical protein
MEGSDQLGFAKATIPHMIDLGDVWLNFKGTEGFSTDLNQS